MAVAENTFDVYDKEDDFINSKNATSEILQKVYADKSFSPTNRKELRFDIGGRRKKRTFISESPTIISSQHLEKKGDIQWVCIREDFWYNIFYR